MIHVVYLTGVSGAGKSTAVHAFEEKGYRVIANVPNIILPSLLEEMKKNPDSYGKTILSQEIRHAKTGLSILTSTSGIRATSIALCCTKEELFKRYRLTRHMHPLQAKGYELEQAIDEDERCINLIRDNVDMLLDTSDLSVDELRETMLNTVRGRNEAGLAISFLSFGYKHGVPSSADFVIDCRDLPNPYWEEGLRDLTGLDQPVIDYLKSKRDVGAYVKQLEVFLSSVFERCEKKGRKFIFVYCGCSGGQHRSVYIANALHELFKDKYFCMVSHRDVDKRGSNV